MPFPTEFPAAQFNLLIGVLLKREVPTLKDVAEAAYDVLGYAGHKLLGRESSGVLVKAPDASAEASMAEVPDEAKIFVLQAAVNDHAAPCHEDPCDSTVKALPAVDWALVWRIARQLLDRYFG